MTDLAFHLYFRLPVLLQHAAVSMYGLQLRRLRYGKVHDGVLDDLRQSQWLDPTELEVLQLSALNRVVRHASQTVPFYREAGLKPQNFESLDQLRELPIVEKDQLRAPRDHLISDHYRDRRTPKIYTGGTTGKPLVIYCDGTTLQTNYAFFARFLEWTGCARTPRVATFAGRTIVPPSQQAPPFWRRNVIMKQMLFSSYHLSARAIPDYVDALRRFRPELIESYPSSISPIARYLVEHGIRDLRPRALVTSSETLTAPARALLEDAFGCPVFDYYAAAEMAALVTQCPEGGYHVNPEFGVVEIMKDGAPVGAGEVGEIIATGFINPVMPLIRYATGDQGALSDEPCRCGRAFPVIDRIEGRVDDVLITPDGRLIGRLDPIFKGVSSILETRIVQDRPDHVRVEVVPTSSFKASDADALRTGLERRMGPSVHVDILEVPAIPRTKAGKVRAVVNEVLSPQTPM
jgi:phenylacetate-CoA ligase